MSLLSGVLGTKVTMGLLFALVTWGITSGFNWWDNREEKARAYAERAQAYNAAKAYADAYDQERQARERTEKALLVSERERTIYREAESHAIQKIYEIASKEDVVTSAGTYSNTAIPGGYLDVLRDTIRASPNSPDGKGTKSAPSKSLRRLRDALDGETNVRSEPGD